MKNKIMLVDEFGSISETKFYQPQEYLKLHENYKPSTNQKVLGIVEGKSFVLDGVSRNGRFYPKKLWENAIKDPEVKQMLNEKLMFGCIGHPENYTLDELLQEGKVSHIVTDIKLGNDGYGYATYEILDTPAGRILETVLKAGSKMKVSTRGFGEFLNESKEIDGKRYQVINPNTFQLESIDFVIKPGIASVDVNLVEELEKNNKKDIEKLKESKIHLCEDGVCTIISEIEIYENLKKENKKLQSIIKNLKEENEVLQNKLLENNSNEDNNSTKNKKINFINTMIVSYIEYFLKDSNVDKKLDDIKNSMIEYLDVPLEDINSNILEKFLEELNSYNGENIYIENLKKYVKELQEIIGKESKSEEDKIKDIINKSNDLIVNLNQKNLEEEYQNLIKDLTKKLLKENKSISELKEKLNKFKKSYYETLKLLENEKNIVESQDKILNKKNKEYKNLLNIVNKLEENINSLTEKLYENEKQKHKLEIEYKLLKESKNLIDERLLSKKVNEEIDKLKKDIKKELEEENKIVLELEKQKIKENLKNEFLNKIEELKENLQEKNDELNLIEEKLKIIDSKKENYKSKLDELEELLLKEKQLKEEIENQLKDFQIKYLESLYKLDKTTIIEILNNYKDINKAKQILESKQEKSKKILVEDYGLDYTIKKEIKETKKERDLLDKLI